MKNFGKHNKKLLRDLDFEKIKGKIDTGKLAATHMFGLKIKEIRGCSLNI